METLDYAFLKHIGVSVDGEEALHAFYLPMLAGYDRVLDLGCGMGGFVKLLRNHGFAGYGVDSDSLCIAEAKRHDLPVVEADIVEHLRTLQPDSLDAIFSAHVVEHMPYEVVLETVQLAFRALRPGGRLLLVTPNPRALISHLELYHMHFGHVAMYHPKLLAFFMQHSGFHTTDFGENPHTMPRNVSSDSPLLALQSLRDRSFPTPFGKIEIRQVLPVPVNPLRRLVWQVKVWLIHWLVQPYFDHSMRELNRLQGDVKQVDHALRTTLEAVDRPFEIYVIGDK